MDKFISTLVPTQEVDDEPTNIWDHSFESWGTVDPAKIPPRRWIYDKHYLEGALSATIADGAGGKSILALTEAIAIVTGRPLLGVTPAKPEIWDGEIYHREVVYYNAEESLDEIKRRVCAICQHFRIDQRELGGNYLDDATGKVVRVGKLTVVSGHDFPFVVGIARNGSVEFNTNNLECLEHSDSVNVVILDPFVSIHQCPENDNNLIDAVVKRLGRVAATPPIKSIELAHHSRKVSGEISGADARGASALFDGVRALRTLNPMSQSEAERSRVDDRHWYFRINGGKANYSAPGSDSMWLQHKSVLLPNGDDMGVVIPWKAPGPLDDVTPQQEKQVCDLIRGGDYRVDSQASQWVGNVVGQVLDVDVETEASREQIKAILKQWFASGVLKKVERRSRGRHLALVVEPGKAKKVKIPTASTR
jgi:AAA domain